MSKEAKATSVGKATERVEWTVGQGTPQRFIADLCDRHVAKLQDKAADFRGFYKFLDRARWTGRVPEAKVPHCQQCIDPRPFRTVPVSVHTANEVYIEHVDIPAFLAGGVDLLATTKASQKAKRYGLEVLYTVSFQLT